MRHLLVSANLLEEQARAIFLAWGSREDQAQASARILVEADLAGIESHGVGLLTMYAQQIANGAVVPGAEITTVIDRGAMAVLDGGGEIGRASCRERGAILSVSPCIEIISPHKNSSKIIIPS